MRIALCAIALMFLKIGLASCLGWSKSEHSNAVTRQITGCDYSPQRTHTGPHRACTGPEMTEYFTLTTN